MRPLLNDLELLNVRQPFLNSLWHAVVAFGVARKPAVPKFPFHFADQPLRKFVKMKYVVHLSVGSPGVGAITAYEFRANGI